MQVHMVQYKSSIRVVLQSVLALDVDNVLPCNMRRGVRLLV
jgi:hypothetical protein